MARIRRGDAAALPLEAQIHVVAARYGQSPEDVAEWPADRFLEAIAYLPITGVM